MCRLEGVGLNEGRSLESPQRLTEKSLHYLGLLKYDNSYYGGCTPLLEVP